jgi:hypothetical protein
VGCFLKVLHIANIKVFGALALFWAASHCPQLEVLAFQYIYFEQLDFGTSFAKPSPCLRIEHRLLRYCSLVGGDVSWQDTSGVQARLQMRKFADI